MRSSKASYAALRWGTFALALGFAASWSPRRSVAMVPAAAQGPTVPPPADGQHGEGRKGEGQFRDSAVYVDGKAVGVLAYSELPPGLAPFTLPELDGLDVPRYYRMTDYLKGVGVDVARIREIHFYGSHDRVAIVSGEAFRAAADRMVFDFTQQVAGKPRARWSQLHALSRSPMVDLILATAIYMDRPAPAYEHGEFLLDGKEVAGIPYVEDGVPKGTRVYVDGKLAGWLRRKTLPDKLIAPGSSRTHASFSTDAFLSYVGADPKAARTIDFLRGDSLAARVDGKAWAQSKEAFTFDLPGRSHGQIHESFPGDQTAGISSVRLYVHAAAPARSVQPEAMEPHGGSGAAQADGVASTASAGNSDVTAVAQTVKSPSSEEF